jgi:hypothetical protein
VTQYKFLSINGADEAREAQQRAGVARWQIASREPGETRAALERSDSLRVACQADQFVVLLVDVHKAVALMAEPLLFISQKT